MTTCRRRNLERVSCGSLVLALVLMVTTACPVHALTSYLDAFRTQYPAAAGSRIDGCSLCHSTVPQLNPYGSAFLSAEFNFPPIEGLDSDGDGFANLAEIQALTFPGNPADTPAVLPSPTPTATAFP